MSKTLILSALLVLCIAPLVYGGRPQTISFISQSEEPSGSGDPPASEVSNGYKTPNEDQSQSHEKDAGIQTGHKGEGGFGQTSEQNKDTRTAGTSEADGFRKLPSAALLTETAEAAADLITDLPGQPEVDFLQYSGYVTINETTGKNFFYWLAEAVEPAEEPLVLWLNGGPGCSSIGGGLMTENGPWRVSDSSATTLDLNPYAWNALANMLFLESPAGVGFSYSLTISDLTTGDAQTAADNYAFLQGFLKRHTRYQGRDFYITGESYAGHYIPQLAKAILEGNKDNANIYIPLQGFAAGNPLTEVSDDVLRGPLLSYYNHAMISDYTWATLDSKCNFSYDIFSSNGFAIPDTSEACNSALLDAWIQIGNVDPYDIFADSCTYVGGSQGQPLDKTNLHKYLPGLRVVRDARYKAISQMAPSPLASTVTPAQAAFSINNSACLDVWTEAYLNRQDVKEAIHAKTDLPYAWTDCSEVLIYDYVYSFPESIVPLYADFLENYPNLRILVYSGDTDTVVPFVGTRKWLATLPMNVTKPYYAWYNLDQVGGYAQVYSGNLTFATVRGAGHLVPLGQPARALKLFTSFLTGEMLPGPPAVLV